MTLMTTLMTSRARLLPLLLSPHGLFPGLSRRSFSTSRVSSKNQPASSSSSSSSLASQDRLGFRQVVQDPKLAHVAVSQLKNKEKAMSSGRRKRNDFSDADSAGARGEGRTSTTTTTTETMKKMTPWAPLKRITRQQMEQLRALHQKAINSLSLCSSLFSTSQPTN